MRRAFRVRIGTTVHVIRRRAAFLIMHLSGLDGIRRREPASIPKPHAGLGAEPADTAATGVAQCAKLFPIEEVSRASRQPGFNARRRFWRHHMQQFQVRARRFEYDGFRWSGKHARSFFRVMNLILETNDAFGRSAYYINKVVIVAGLDVELAAGEYRSLVDREIFRTAEIRTAESHLGSGFHAPGLSGIGINYREVVDTCHVSMLLIKTAEHDNAG